MNLAKTALFALSLFFLVLAGCNAPQEATEPEVVEYDLLSDFIVASSDDGHIQINFVLNAHSDTADLIQVATLIDEHSDRLSNMGFVVHEFSVEDDLSAIKAVRNGRGCTALVTSEGVVIRADCREEDGQWFKVYDETEELTMSVFYVMYSSAK